MYSLNFLTSFLPRKVKVKPSAIPTSNMHFEGAIEVKVFEVKVST